MLSFFVRKKCSLVLIVSLGMEGKGKGNHVWTRNCLILIGGHDGEDGVDMSEWNSASKMPLEWFACMHLGRRGKRSNFTRGVFLRKMDVH